MGGTHVICKQRLDPARLFTSGQSALPVHCWSSTYQRAVSLGFLAIDLSIQRRHRNRKKVNCCKEESFYEKPRSKRVLMINALFYSPKKNFFFAAQNSFKGFHDAVFSFLYQFSLLYFSTSADWTQLYWLSSKKLQDWQVFPLQSRSSRWFLVPLQCRKQLLSRLDVRAYQPTFISGTQEKKLKVITLPLSLFNLLSPYRKTRNFCFIFLSHSGSNDDIEILSPISSVLICIYLGFWGERPTIVCIATNEKTRQPPKWQRKVQVHFSYVPRHSVLHRRPIWRQKI